MAIDAAAIRLSIVELMEGSIGTDPLASGLFKLGVFAGQKPDATASRLRQSSVGTHWFDVRLGIGSRSAASNVASGNPRRLLNLDVTIDVRTQLLTEVQASERDSTLAVIASDCSDAILALSTPGNIATTADGNGTGIVGGRIGGANGRGRPSWRLVAEDWSSDARHVRHEIRGEVTVRATVSAPSPSTFVTSTSMAMHLSPSSIYADSGSVFAWEDLSDETNHFTATGTARPAITRWIDGRDGVRFDGVNDILRCSAFTGVAAGDKPVVIVVMAGDPTQSASLTAATMLYLVSDEDTESVGWLQSSTTRAECRARLGSGTGTLTNANTGGTSYHDGSPHLFRGVFANASDSTELWIDETLRSTSSAVAGGLTYTLTRAAIGGGIGSASNPTLRWLKATIGEVIIFANRPTDDEITALMDGYIAPTWPTVYGGLA